MFTFEAPLGMRSWRSEVHGAHILGQQDVESPFGMKIPTGTCAHGHGLTAMNLLRLKREVNFHGTSSRYFSIKSSEFFWILCFPKPHWGHQTAQHGNINSSCEQIQISLICCPDVWKPWVGSWFRWVNSSCFRPFQLSAASGCETPARGHRGGRWIFEPPLTCHIGKSEIHWWLRLTHTWNIVWKSLLQDVARVDVRRWKPIL